MLRSTTPAHRNCATASTTAESAALRRDVRVIGLVGSAHCLSHFFQLVLPPLFPLLKAEFDVEVAPFLLDIHPVTVAEFARFAPDPR